MNEENPRHPNKVREFREKIGYSRAQVAELAGVHIEHLAKIERGEVSPSLETAQKLRNVLRLGADELL